VIYAVKKVKLDITLTGDLSYDI